MSLRLLSPVWLLVLFVAIVAGLFFWPARKTIAPGPATVAAEWTRPLEAGEGGRFAALAPDGSVWLWGAGEARAQARRLPGAEGVVALSQSREHSLALARDGRVWSWGENGHGQLGHSTDKPGAVRDPELVPGLADIVRVLAVQGASYALARDGTLWGWGRAAWGRFGPAVKEGAVRKPLRLAHVAQAIDVAGGADGMLYLKRDGTVWFWGRLPPAVKLAAPGMAVAVGAQPLEAPAEALPVEESVAERPAEGAARDRILVPEPVDALEGIVAIAAHGGKGASFAALGREGGVWAWGDAASACAEAPGLLRVPGLEPAKAIAAGPGEIVAIGRDGGLWRWSPTAAGSCPETAERIAGIDDAVAVAATGAGVAFARADGSLWQWGRAGASAPAAIEPSSPLRIAGPPAIAAR